MSVKIPKAFRVTIKATVKGEDFEGTGLAYGDHLFTALDSLDDVEWEGVDPDKIKTLLDIGDDEDASEFVSALSIDVKRVRA